MNMGRVINYVGAVLALSTTGIIALGIRGETIPDVLQNVAVGSLTGLVGLLARPNSSDNS